MKMFSRTATAAHFRLIVCGLTMFGLIAQPGLAQQDPPEVSAGNWYQIHLAIFGHRSESAEYEEVWRNNLQLKYPQNLIRLKTRERYLADLCGLTTPAGSAVDTGSGGNRLLDVLERVDSGEGYGPEDYPEPARPVSAATLDPACKGVRPDLFPADKDQIANTQAAAVVASAESLLSDKSASPAESESAAPQLTPYILSKQISDGEFAEQVKKLNGAYRYRLLFSGSWPQPLQPRNQATALLIEGGDAVGQHHELEGFIRIGLERYLHIDTDLWLSQFSAQRPANRPVNDNLASGNDYSAARQTPFQTQTDAPPQRLSEFPALPIPFPRNDRNSPRSASPSTAPLNPPASASATDSTATGGDQGNNYRPSSNLDVLAAEDSSYFVNRTVVMRANRRMRSGEVHYLDHPMFGVLIKITPIKTPGADGSQPGT